MATARETPSRAEPARESALRAESVLQAASAEWTPKAGLRGTRAPQLAVMRAVVNRVEPAVRAALREPTAARQARRAVAAS
jgi:hypothetical protein